MRRVLLLLIFCGFAASHDHSTSNTAYFVSFTAGDSAQLMIEAAHLLSQNEFNCSLILVGPAVYMSNLPRVSPTFKIYKLPWSTNVNETRCDAELETLNSCELSLHLRACETLLNSKIFMQQFHNSNPRLLMLPGFLHDACVIPALAGSNTAAMVWSVGSVSSAWLGHVTNAIPFSSNNIPLQEPAISSLQRVFSAWKWSRFISQVEYSYVYPALSLVSAKLNITDYSLDEMYNSVAFLMSASHPLLERPVAAYPMRIAVGCFHCRHARPLPKELQEWFPVNKKGSLIVSNLPYNKKNENILLSAAFAYPQFSFLWIVSEFDAEEKDWPFNLVQNYICPVQDAIGHSRAKLFISECSETSVLMGVYHGVSIICIPRTLDQQETAKLIKTLNIGFSIEPNANSTIIEEIKTLTSDSKYRIVSQHLGIMVRDEPETSADRLLFWAGHAARHWGHVHEQEKRDSQSRCSDYSGFLTTGIMLGLLIGIMMVPVCTILIKLVLKWRRDRNSLPLASAAERNKTD